LMIVVMVQLMTKYFGYTTRAKKKVAFFFFVLLVQEMS